MKTIDLERMIRTEQYDKQFKCVNCGYYWEDHRVSVVTHKTPTLTCPRYKVSTSMPWYPATTSFQNGNNDEDT